METVPICVSVPLENTTLSDTKVPDTTLTVLVDGKEREIFMSFGLLAELANTVGSIERIINVDLDPDTAMLVLYSLLVPRDKKGKVSDTEYQLPSLDTEVAEEMLNWVGDHLMGFFLRGLRRGMNRIDGNKEKLTEVGSLLPSMAISPSVEPS